MNFLKFALSEHLSQNRETCLYFSLRQLEKNALALKQIANDNVRFLFPVKSFPSLEIIQLIGSILNGFDISNENELSMVYDFISANHLIWSSAPYCWSPKKPIPIYFDVQDTESIAPDFAIKSLRIHIPQDDSFASRFGESIHKIKSVSLLNNKIQAIHLHQAGDFNTVDFYNSTTKQFAEILNENPQIEAFNFGGGQINLSISDFKEITSFATQSLPNKKIIYEPGRWLCKNAGICIGTILNITQQENRTIVTTSISKEAHIKWPNRHLKVTFHKLNSNNAKPCQNLAVTGPTCDEFDIITEMPGSQENLSIGDLIAIEGITGYSYAWNHSFNGVPVAETAIL